MFWSKIGNRTWMTVGTVRIFFCRTIGIYIYGGEIISWQKNIFFLLNKSLVHQPQIKPCMWQNLYVNRISTYKLQSLFGSACGRAYLFHFSHLAQMASCQLDYISIYIYQVLTWVFRLTLYLSTNHYENDFPGTI